MFLRMCVASFLFVFVLVPSVLGFDNKMANNISQQPCPPVYCTNGTQPVFCSRTIIDGCGQPNLQIKIENGTGRWYEAHRLVWGIAITDREVCKSLDDSSIHNMTSTMITLLKCNETSNSPFELEECGNWSSYRPYDKKSKLEPNCSVVHVPWIAISLCHDLFTLGNNTTLLDYFHIKCPWCGRPPACPYQYQCVESVDSKPQPNAEEPKDIQMALKIGLAFIIAGGVVMMFAVPYCYFKKICSNKKTAEEKNIDSFLKNYGPIAPRRFKYLAVKKMTGSFKNKLSEGGFGGVFKGKLDDGSFVAVKLLKESKTNGQEFINEVASISRTSHVNIVTMLGFCSDGSKRALIYEFMSNGSLEKFISNESTSKLHQQQLHKIALGVAKGLEYLHRGCNTRILHFDIKPHNILLDDNFCPKISDFGLAKICIKKDSIVSMTCARGTVGYIAPEVFCRNFGGVSHKSDVYSYGMLVLEMICGRKNVCVEADNTSEIYFPDWIYKRMKLDQELGIEVIGNERELLARKMAVVGLWCIQTDPSNRPPMSRVVEMLQGSLESLQIPPKPYLISPTKSQQFIVASSSEE